MLTEAENMLNRLAAADRVCQKEDAMGLLLRATPYGCGFILAAFCLDVVFHLGAAGRLGILLAGLAGAGALLGVAWYRAFVRRNRPERIARFLEIHNPTLGSRLINLLQLSEQTSDPDLAPLTRELALQAVRDYAAELSGLPVEQLARTRAWQAPLRRAAWIGTGFAAVLLLGLRISGLSAITRPILLPGWRSSSPARVERMCSTARASSSACARPAINRVRSS